MWALGAVVGPPLIALFAREGRLVRPLIGLAALLFGIALLIARRPLATILRTESTQAEPERSGALRAIGLRAWASPYAMLTGGLIFIYVGTETAAAGWIASYTQCVSARQRAGLGR